SRQRQCFVAPQRFDVCGSGGVGPFGDAPYERRRLERDAAVRERPDNQQTLARPDIDGNTDDQIGVCAESRFGIVRHRLDFMWRPATLTSSPGPRDNRRAVTMEELADRPGTNRRAVKMVIAAAATLTLSSVILAQRIITN